VERLGEFVRQMERILANYGTQGEIYAHASAGCLHIRPLLNLKSAQGVKNLRQIAEESIQLTLSLGGSVSGEHGVGLARSEWLEAAYGKEVLAAFKELKRSVDPEGLFNPGKIVSLVATEPVQRMDTRLRFGPEYKAQAWQPEMGFSNPDAPSVPGDPGGNAQHARPRKHAQSNDLRKVPI